ncbi:hypothetical protein BMR1_03g04830 [Babesia microti strain RI]|uniref:Uncharacterized protein n=1 Tax=Babesia microti (strain RI) TaxID=1133968 RepID=A0A0K3ASG5_BABMR|nr:hypothetical protein BMR1_03g04830 [Babesia microti strain RI]CTQ41563.1 hypothetical protein BMR1_03g04830 [Babesia microti strain RI]|eukprot:XP_012649574.1 hypothetical protein BMR1_03g04830 [Babesia microti strain RI]
MLTLTYVTIRPHTASNSSQLLHKIGCYATTSNASEICTRSRIMVPHFHRLRWLIV